MARVEITTQSIEDTYTKAVTDNLTFTATSTDGNYISPDGNDLLLLIWDTDTAAATNYLTVQGGSVKPYGEQDDTIITLDDENEFAQFRVSAVGYTQSDGRVYLDTSSADIKVAAVLL